MKDLVTELEEKLLADGVIVEDYDVGTGFWGTLVEDLVSDLCDAGYMCDSATERFGSPVGHEAMSTEIRFDGGEGFKSRKVTSVIVAFFKGISDSVRTISIPSKYGRSKVIATMDRGDEVIVDTDNLSNVDDPYVTMYLLSPVKNESVCESKVEGKNPGILYTGVVLDSDSKRDLERFFTTKFPDLDGWKVKCHHVTIKLGALHPEFRDGEDAPLRPGKKVDMIVTASGADDKAAGVKVSVLDSEVAQAISEQQKKSSAPMSYLHITLATSSKGNPSDTRNISDWHPIEEEMKVSGEIREVSGT